MNNNRNIPMGQLVALNLSLKHSVHSGSTIH